MSHQKRRPWVAGPFIACAAALICAPTSGADEDRPKPGISAAEIAKLILQLDAETFTTREQAHQALLRIGKPALPALRKVVSKAPSEEVRQRATRLLRQIDPAGERRAEVELHRVALLKAMSGRNGVDVKNWAESVANPFTDLTDEGKQRLTDEGINVPRLLKMRARLLQGSYGGANAKTFVNDDPDTILIVGKGFCTHGDLHSAGPVLAVEDAYFMSVVNVANLLWFVDRAGASNAVTGAPVVMGAAAGIHARRSTPGILFGDFGWRKPKHFLQPPTAADAKNDPPSTDELAQARKQIVARVEGQRGTDVTQFANAVPNPFTALTEEGKTKLSFRGINVDRLAKRKALYLTGSYCGANSKDFVNKDPETILVIGKGFVTHGQVHSLGPILAVEDAHFMGDVTGADVVWFADRSFPRGRTTGAPVILAPTASHSQMQAATKHVWHGDYGWRAPKGFAE